MISSSDRKETGAQIVRTACSSNCTNMCGLKAFVENGRIVRLEPGDFPDRRYRRICAMGIAALQRLDSPDRLKYPMKRIGERGEGRFERITWDEALNIIGGQFAEVARSYGPGAVAWQTMSGNPGVLSLVPAVLMNLIGGTISSTSGIMGDHAVSIGTRVTTGMITPGSEMATVGDAKLVILWPNNLVETLLGDSHFLLDARERGTELVVIDPRFSPTAAFADWWIPIQPGTDAALAMGMMRVMLKESLWDEHYMLSHTVGPLLVRADNGMLLRERDLSQVGAADGYVVWDRVADRACPVSAAKSPAMTGAYQANGIGVKPAFQLLREAIEEYTPERVERITRVPARDVVRLARMYAGAKPAQIRFSQGMCRYHNGHQAFRAAITLSAMHGSIGQPGGGFSSHGGFGAFMKLINAAAALNQPHPERSARNLMSAHLCEAIADGKPWPVKALWFTRCNLLNQGPDRNRLIEDVFPKLDFILVSEIEMTDTARWADLLLPVTTHFEETDLVGGWSNSYVQLRQQAIPPMGECKSDFEATALIGRRMGFGAFFEASPEQWIDRILTHDPRPTMKGITLDSLRQSPVRMNVPDPWIAFADQKFRTPTGRLEFYTEEWKPFGQELPIYVEQLEGPGNPKAKQYPLSFISSHSRFSANSFHRNLPWLREIDPEPRLEMNSADAECRGIADGELVIVFNERGSCKLKVKITEGIMPGVVSSTQGWWGKFFAEGHYQGLTHYALNPLQERHSETNFAVNDILVEVRKALGATDP